MATENAAVSVIICAYTEKRWDNLVAAVDSAQHQSVSPKEIIVVIDHNPNLLLRVKAQLVDVLAIENQQAKGASGTRNSGVAVSTGSILAFLDDDAIAEPNWIKSLVACYTDARVAGVGGKIEPLWLGTRPFWFPDEFNWVVGCTYRGMPTKNTAVRNLIGANMSVRKHILTDAGGFRASFGNNKGERTVRNGMKWLQHHAGDEETELCIRVTQQRPESVWLYTTSATIQHCVPPQRTQWAYFLWRCYDEGLGKALLVRMYGTQRGLSSERTYTYKVLPLGVLLGLTDALFRLDSTGLARSGAIVMGLAMTIAGYLVGTFLPWVVAARNMLTRSKLLHRNPEMPPSLKIQ